MTKEEFDGRAWSPKDIVMLCSLFRCLPKGSTPLVLGKRVLGVNRDTGQIQVQRGASTVWYRYRDLKYLGQR